jgi:hypothetical protein
MLKIDKKVISIISGMMPAANKRSMGVSDIIPYNISGKLGGISMPMLPEQVNNPRVNVSEYFSERRIGYSKPPRAMIVTPDTPVNAEKNAQLMKATTGTPPGSHPNKALVKLTILRGALLSARMYPVKVNKGIASNAGALASLTISIIITALSISILAKAYNATEPITQKRGTPNKAERTRKTTVTIYPL